MGRNQCFINFETPLINEHLTDLTFGKKDAHKNYNNLNLKRAYEEVLQGSFHARFFLLSCNLVFKNIIFYLFGEWGKKLILRRPDFIGF